MALLQDEITSYLDDTGESMASLSRRAGRNAKAVSDILGINGLRPSRATIEALSRAMGRDLPVEDAPAPITFAALIARLPERIPDETKARRLAQRLRWLLREAGWIAEVTPVIREDVQAFLARTNAATFGIGPKSLATYKAEIMSAIDFALPRSRGRDIRDIGGVHKDAHAAISASDLPQDLKLVSGSFLAYLHDCAILPGNVTRQTLQDYYVHRMQLSPKGEAVARKHVKRISGLLARLASRADFARFGFAAAEHPFGDRRDRYEVPNSVIAGIMAEFDRRVGPWALGEQSRDGQPLAAFIAWLDAQGPTEADAKRALLRRGGLRARDEAGGKAREASLSARGFLLPRSQWSAATLARRRGFVAAGAKALYARTGFLIETLEELTDPEIAWSLATALVDANRTGFESGYAGSVMKMIVKLAAEFVGRSDADLAELRASVAALDTRDGMSARNVAKLRAFTPDRIALFLRVSDRILDDVNARSDLRRGSAGGKGQLRPTTRFDSEQCRDIMCALAHEIMLARAPRSANLIGMRLDWIRWAGDRASIVVPSTEVKLRSSRDPDLVIDLSADASRLLRQYLDKVRPAALTEGDQANPYLFPGQGQDLGVPYVSLLARLVRWVFAVTGAEIHPHLFRHMIGWIWLREDISMLPVVQRLLGHKNLQTAIAYYAAVDESLAMQAWQDNINAQRQAKY